ncbi:MAG: lactate dehydrogenase [Bacteroidetes bacterium]|nr:lactate dehydrogenase [Bacteroidota bacterium]
MSKIAITDYFTSPSREEVSVLGDLVGMEVGEDTEVLLVWHEDIDENYVSKLPNLRAVQRYGVGFDTLDLDYLKSRGIICCNNPDYGVDEVSDTAVAYIMSISRGILRYDAMAQKLTSELWQESVLTDIKRNKETKVGVIGAGRIGSSVAMKCNAIGFSTLFYDPYKESGHDKVIRAKRAWTLEEFLSEADIISIHCPLNKETTGMVNEEFISKMKTGASIVNTARGGMFKNTDLIYESLENGKLLSAYIDVLPIEPPPNDKLMNAWRNQPDWLKGRLIINPHTSYFSQESIIDLRYFAALNAKRLYDGANPLNLL